MVEQLVRGVLEQQRWISRAAEELNQPPEKVEKDVAEYLKQPPLELSVTTFRTDGGFRYDAQAQAVFGIRCFTPSTPSLIPSAASCSGKRRGSGTG